MVSKLGPDTNPVGMFGWQVEAQPPNAGAEHPTTVRIHVTSTTRSKMTGAGQAALLAVFSAYLTSSKAAALIVRHGPGGDTGLAITRSAAWMTVLPEDGPAQIAAICAVFQAAGNIT